MFKINIKIGVNVLATNETLAHDPLGLFLRTSRLMTGGRSQSLKAYVTAQCRCRSAMPEPLRSRVDTVTSRW